VIKGLGVDLCSNSRMKSKIRNSHFVKKVFTPEEINYSKSGKYPEKHFASSFAAREAFAKASGLGLFQVVFHGVWLDRTNPVPVLGISQKIIETIAPDGNLKTWVSISHEYDLTVAVVILEVS
jgi:holo-[acyl-carrier protein] synthase